MTLTDEQLRQVRVWAIETSLGASSIERSNANLSQDNLLALDLEQIIVFAGELVNFVTADRPVSPSPRPPAPPRR